MLGSLRFVQALLIFTWLLIPVGALYIKFQRDASQAHLRYQALKLITDMTQEAHRKYSDEVLTKFKALHPIRSDTDHTRDDKTVPAPATFAIELAESVSNTDISVRMYSKHPFRNRKKTAVAQTQLESEALDRLIAGDPEFIHSDSERYFYAKPVKMVSQSCIDCHNNHEDSSYHDWKIGDVRSALVAEMKLPPDRLAHLYPSFFVVLLAVIATPIMLLDRLSRMDQFQRQLQLDHLTGAHNRTYIDEHIKEVFDKSFTKGALKHGPAVMILDLDHFKQTNDQHGHVIGDECLQEVASRIALPLRRDKDLVARYGGEEFLIYIEDCDYGEAFEIAGRVLRSISRTPMTSKDLQITASIGVCHVGVDQHAPSFEEACKLADEALYQAKDNGRDQAVSCRYGEALVAELLL